MKFLSNAWRQLLPSPRRDERSGKPLPHWKLLAKEQQDVTDNNHINNIDHWQPPKDGTAFWKQHLTPDEHRILFQQGTERAGSSVYDKFYPRRGHFCCRACGIPLYQAMAKFDSGTGWPSFGAHVAGHVATRRDVHALLGQRTELHCARCHGHLGHVFGVGAQQFSVRYKPRQFHTERQCINGRSIYYVAEALPADTAQETALGQSTSSGSTAVGH